MATAPAPTLVQRVRLEDRGQAFRSFDLDAEGRIRNANTLGFHFDGQLVSNAPLEAGDRVEFGAGGWLAHRVLTVEPIREEDAS